MCFWFIHKTAWTASSWTGALVAVVSLQPYIYTSVVAARRAHVCFHEGAFLSAIVCHSCSSCRFASETWVRWLIHRLKQLLLLGQDQCSSWVDDVVVSGSLAWFEGGVLFPWLEGYPIWDWSLVRLLEKLLESDDHGAWRMEIGRDNCIFNSWV